ncbi:DeoR family transcriptional regulator, partial [Lacticaseibacillus paracasei subsp. paracasei Lpp126]
MEIDERRHSILNEVNQNRNVKISTLSKQMDVSRETIRKDIYSLAKQGLVSAVRGGAEAIVDDPTSRFDQRKAINQQAKQKMAQRALSYIKDGATIFLDS